MAGTKRLDALLASGVIWIDEREYVGRASDGVEVQLGTVGEEANVERYLAANPTPDTW